MLLHEIPYENYSMVSPWEDSRSRDLRKIQMDVEKLVKTLTPEEMAMTILREREEKARLQERTEKQDEAIASLERHVKWLTNVLWGSRSERRVLDHLEPAEQLLLDGTMLDLPKEPPSDSDTVESLDKKYRKKKTSVDDKSTGGARFDENVPTIEVPVEDPNVAGVDPENLTVIETRYSDRIVALPPFARLRMVIQTTKNELTGEVSRPEVPKGVWDQCCADVSFLAKLVTDKFCYHLPLYRQHKELKQNGIHINRGTLSRYIHRTAELMEPIYNAVLSSILGSDVVSMDETPVKAGRAEGGGKMKQGYFWPLYGNKDEIYFLFSPTRSGKVVEDVLAGFEGTLLSDGYDVYERFAEKVDGLIWAACWAHVRRKFVEVEDLEPEKVETVLLWMQALYRVEKDAGGDRKRRKKLRAEISCDIVDKIFKYFKKILAESTLPDSSPFIGAIKYALKREAGLRAFLDNPDVPIDNNHTEREIRPVALGRKNWLFNWTKHGARFSAILYTLVSCCRLQGIDPTTYLVDILQRIQTHPAVDTHLLTPRNWKENFASNPLGSVADRLTLAQAI